MVGKDDEEPPLRQEKRFLKNQRLKFKVGVVLQHMDLAHKGALLRVGEGSFLDVLVQLDGRACRSAMVPAPPMQPPGQPMPSSR